MNSKEFFGKLIKLQQTLKTSKKVKVTAIVLAAVLVLFVGFTVYSAAYSAILPHVYIEGTDVGGMSADDALALINKNYSGLAGDRSLTLVCADAKQEVLLSGLGVKVSHDETVANALSVGRQKGLLSKTANLVKSFFVRTEIPLVISANIETFNSIIDEISAPYVVPVENASYHLEGSTLVITKGEPGKVVDKTKALDLLFDAVADKSIEKIELVPEETQPKAVDVDKFYELLSDTPRDAYYKYENGTVSVVDEVPGIVVSKDTIAKAFESPEHVFRVPVEIKAANKTAEQLRSMLFRDTLASYSSSFATSTANRAQNVSLSASRVNGYILMPGDVFSYDSAIGRRTAANGYREAGVYVGNKQETGIGGGICQTSSTLYAAALYANLEIVSRTSHSLPVSYIPAGMDATIAEGYIDLKIRNNTEYPVKLVAAVNGRSLTCSVLGVKVEGQTVEIINTRTGTLSPKTVRTPNPQIPVGYKRVISKGAGGYTVASQRIVKMNGETVKTEKLSSSVYKAADIEEEINPADENTPSSSLAIYDPSNPPSAEPPTVSETDTPPDGGTEEPPVADAPASMDTPPSTDVPAINTDAPSDVASDSEEAE